MVKRPSPANDNLPLFGRFEDGKHIFPIRIYHEDVDVAGVVYHANYLKFAERARSECLRLLGFPHVLMEKGDPPSIFAVRHVELECVKPAFLEDMLEVTTTRLLTSPEEAEKEAKKAARLFFHQRITRGNRSSGEQEDIAILVVEIVCLHALHRKPIRFATPLLEAIEKKRIHSFLEEHP